RRGAFQARSIIQRQGKSDCAASLALLIAAQAGGRAAPLRLPPAPFQVCGVVLTPQSGGYLPASASSSARVIAIITISPASLILPDLLRRPFTRLSISRARFIKYPSRPSSQGIRNCRPLIVKLTRDIPRGQLYG